MRDSGKLRLQIRLALAIVYLVWGSAYVATKVMVTDEPPLSAAGLRFTLAGLLLGAFAWWRSGPPRLSRVELRHVGIVALFAIVVSNGCNVLAMQHVQSNVAAMLNATPALWIAWFGTFGRHGTGLSGPARLGLLVGLAGVVLVLAPAGAVPTGPLRWQLVILLGCIGWSLGTIYYRHAAAASEPLMFTALQMFAGGLALLLLAAVHGEPLALTWTPRGIAAFLWLMLLSSCVAYSAYAFLALHTTPVIVGSFGFVNPAVAALVGWLLLGETLAWTQIAGMLVILAGMALVTGYWRPLPRAHG
ncbi:MAG: EamA family transporter [Gammaproteobacteria bacterium]|nr:EamA family transporter [Gammaproteobacteria bacterium]